MCKQTGATRRLNEINLPGGCGGANLRGLLPLLCFAANPAAEASAKSFHQLLEPQRLAPQAPRLLEASLLPFLSGYANVARNTRLQTNRQCHECGSGNTKTMVCVSAQVGLAMISVQPSTRSLQKFGEEPPPQKIKKEAKREIHFQKKEEDRCIGKGRG